MKNRLFNFLFLLIGISFALLIGELAIRFMAPQKLVRPCVQNDPELSFKGVPDCSYFDDWHPEFYTFQVNLNNLGLRMEQDVLPGAQNIAVCLGDSYTYGLGVNLEDAYFGKLNEVVEKENWTLVNGSWYAYSTGHDTKALEQLAEKIPVKKAIYFMNNNDLFDNVNQNPNYRTHSFEEDENGKMQVHPAKVYSKWKRRWHQFKPAMWLYKHSHLFILLKQTIQGKVESIVPGRPFFDTEIQPTEVDTMIRVSIAHLENLYQTCQEKEIELMVVWIPNWLELDIENTENWVNNFPYATFKNALVKDSLGFKFYDPTAQMNNLLSNKKAKLSDYYFLEGHFNENGNALYFESVRDSILSFIRE